MKSQNLPGASFNTRFSFAQHTENVNLKQKKKKKGNQRSRWVGKSL